MITTIVTFTCNDFQTTVTNDNVRYSDDMALWLSVEIGNSGYELVDEISHNDAGSEITFMCEKHPYNFTIRYIDGSEWAGYLSRNMGLLPSLIGINEHGLQLEAAQIIHEILSNDNRISDIKWYFRDIYTGGDLTQFHTEPAKA